MKYLSCTIVALLMSGCISIGPPPTVFSFSDSAYGVYTDKDVNYIVYLGNKNHYIFTIEDPRIKYLIKHVDKGNLHINFAQNHFIEKIGDVITTNLVDVRFHVKDASPELIEWAKENGIYYDDNTSYGPDYSYQVYLNAQRYIADEDVSRQIWKNREQLNMGFQSLIDPVGIQLKPSPVKMVNGQPYIGDHLLFEVIDYGWIGASQHRTITYKRNVRD